MRTLQGYVEWHIANTIQAIALANGVGNIDIILLSGTILCLTATNQVLDTTRSSVSIVATLINLFTVIMVNTSAKMMVQVVTKQSSFDIFTALFILTISLQCSVTFYKKIWGPVLMT
jgi:hypothetical protein